MRSKDKKESRIGFWGVKPSEEPLKIKYSFVDLTRLFVSESDLDFIIVTGHNTAVGGKEQGIPLEAEHIRGGNFSDLQFLPAIISHFTIELCKRCDSLPKVTNLRVRIVPDIYLQLSDAKNHNLIVLGGGNVNWVTEHIFDKYLENPELLPVHFKTKETHEIIVSELSGKEYAREPNVDYGILEMVPNPWDEEKVIILCCGIDFWSTQAAILALCGNEITNNKFKPKCPAKVLSVKLRSDSIVGFKGNETEGFITIKKDEIYFEE